MPDEDRPTYTEGVRRGAVVVSAQVEDGVVDQAMDVLEVNDAIDLDRREAQWRQEGWTGMPVAAASSSRSNAAPAITARVGGEEVIPIVEESLRVGKRDAERGRVKVRSYVIEAPVTEQVTLHREDVDVQHRAVDRPVAAGEDVFAERVIEATETDEEAVVAKEARVTGEYVIQKRGYRAHADRAGHRAPHRSGGGRHHDRRAARDDVEPPRGACREPAWHRTEPRCRQCAWHEC